MTTTSFSTIVTLAESTEPRLHAEMSIYVRPIFVREGILQFSLLPGAPDDLTDRMSAFLSRTFGFSWDVHRVESGGESSLIEGKHERREAWRKNAEAHPVIQEILREIPGAVVVVPSTIE